MKFTPLSFSALFCKSIIVLFIFILTVSCENKRINPISKHSISLNYKGKVLRFDEFSINKEVPLEMEEIGIRALAKLKIHNGKSIDGYYIVLDFKKNNDNSYSPHAINFGVENIVGNHTAVVNLYSASMSNGLNSTNFVFNSNNKTTSNLEGNFHGKLIDYTRKDALEIYEGNFFLNIDKKN